jgi:hypothetical protein
MGKVRRQWSGVAAGAAFLLVCAGAVLEARPAPQPVAVGVSGKTTVDGRFAPVCKSGEVVDSRPDPAWVGASYGGDHCQAPALPRPVNGLTASREQVVAAMAAAKRYNASAVVFQKCVRDFIAFLAAGAATPLNPAQMIIENHRLAASARSQQTIAALTRGTINDFNRYGSDCPG